MTPRRPAPPALPAALRGGGKLRLKRRCRRTVARCRIAVMASVLAAGMLAASAQLPGPPPGAGAGESVYLAELGQGTLGAELFAQDPDRRRPVASTTKMMTALLTLESGWAPDAELTVPDRLAGELQRIAACGGVGMQLQPGETLRLRDLFYGMVVASANDAAAVLADALSGGDTAAFVRQMNERAAALGCTDTHFTCPHGLYDEGSYSTARDLARIAAALWQSEAYMAAADTTEYQLPATNCRGALTIYTTNRLLCPEDEHYRAAAHGMKTGYTSAAGRCLVTTATHPDAGGSCVLVVLGAGEDRQAIYREAARFLDWALAVSRPQTGPGRREAA